MFCRLFRNLTCLVCRDFRRRKQHVPVLPPLWGLGLMGWDTDLPRRSAVLKQILRGSLTPPLPSGGPSCSLFKTPKFWKCQNDGKPLFFLPTILFFFRRKIQPEQKLCEGTERLSCLVRCESPSLFFSPPSEEPFKVHRAKEAARNIASPLDAAMLCYTETNRKNDGRKADM